MTYLVGTDEAGYGPNLGPLVVSATVWRVPDGVAADELYRLLQGVVAPAPVRNRGKASSGPQPVAIADSKALYQSGKGLGVLERGLLASLIALGHRPKTCRDVWSALAPDSLDVQQKVPWYADFDHGVPQDGGAAELERAGQDLASGLSAAGVQLVAMRSRVVFEEEFNELVERHDSKGAALSHVTLDLVADMLRPLPDGPVSVLCDKHGGRNCYGPLLSETFPEWLIEIYGEGRELSLYRFGPAERRVEIRFQMKAESCVPAALASMASKYLRELAMLAFNAFWLRRVPGLRPTAGYPVDARRFKDAIASQQRELGIDDRLLWRCK